MQRLSDDDLDVLASLPADLADLDDDVTGRLLYAGYARLNPTRDRLAITPDGVEALSRRDGKMRLIVEPAGRLNAKMNRRSGR